MGVPPQFPPVDRPEPDHSGEQFSQGSEFLHVEPSSELSIQRDVFRAEAFSVNDRQRFLRRMGWLLVAGFASFALVSWMLVRSTLLMKYGAQDSEPIAVVKMELGSLARGNMQDAYAQLSERYRKEVPFANYNALVISHRRMFMTREYRVTRHEVHGAQMQIDAQLISINEKHYLAKFTLVQIGGRWWIDDLHWREQASDRREQT